MIMDAQLQFTGLVPASGIGNADGSDSPTTGSQTSSNMIDLHAAGMLPVLASGQGARDLGIGDDPALKILAQVTTTFVGGTSLILALQGAPDNGSGSAGTFATWWISPTYALASSSALNVGSRLFDMDMPRPPASLNTAAAVGEPRFLQFAYTSSGTFTSGKVRIALVLDRHDQFYNGSVNGVLGGYPPGIVIAN